MSNSVEENPWENVWNEERKQYYCWHKDTNEVLWEDHGKWKIHKTAEGKKYYEDPVESRTQWDRPACLGPDPDASQLVHQDSQMTGYEPYSESSNRVRDKVEYGADQRSRHLVPPAEPDYSIRQRDEKFTELIKGQEVQPGWTYADFVRASVDNPDFRALRNPKDRINFFNNYVQKEEQAARERESQRLTKLRADFTRMFQSHPDIGPNTSWDEALLYLRNESIFRSADREDEKRTLFDEYISNLRQASVGQQVVDRRSALETLPNFFGNLDISPVIGFDELKELLSQSDLFQREPTYRSLNEVDMLRKFNDYANSVEMSDASKQGSRDEDRRRERRAREAFLAVITKLRASGTINLLTPWSEVRSHVQDNQAYADCFDGPGMLPGDIYWELQDEEKRQADAAYHALKHFVKDPLSLNVRDFVATLKKDRQTKDWDEELLRRLHQRLIDEVEFKEKHGSKEKPERQQRRAIDNLRSKMRHLDPPIRVGDTWTDVRPRLEELDEFHQVRVEEDRHDAFDRHMRRLREKRDSTAEYYTNYAPGPGYGYSYQCQRDLFPNHYMSRARKVGGDAYEDERRRATADRERSSYNRSGTGLSPPPSRAGDRYDARSSRVDPYERERRDRDLQRVYSSSRADPRDKGIALDYDDGASVGRSPHNRKRRNSSVDERPARGGSNEHPSKGRRISHDHHSVRSMTPKEPARPKDEDYKSGSEEGEIEE